MRSPLYAVAICLSMCWLWALIAFVSYSSGYSILLNEESRLPESMKTKRTMDNVCVYVRACVCIYVLVYISLPWTLVSWNGWAL